MSASSGRFVYVKINDRGSFYPDREIDLSEAAAARLGIKNKGEAAVFIDVAVKTELPVAREMIREAAKASSTAAQRDEDHTQLAESIARMKGR